MAAMSSTTAVCGINGCLRDPYHAGLCLAKALGSRTRPSASPRSSAARGSHTTDTTSHDVDKPMRLSVDAAPDDTCGTCMDDEANRDEEDSDDSEEEGKPGKRVLCGLQGCILPSYHPGLCNVPPPPSRRSVAAAAATAAAAAAAATTAAAVAATSAAGTGAPAISLVTPGKRAPARRPSAGEQPKSPSASEESGGKAPAKRRRAEPRAVATAAADSSVVASKRARSSAGKRPKQSVAAEEEEEEEDEYDEYDEHDDDEYDEEDDISVHGARRSVLPDEGHVDGLSVSQLRAILHSHGVVHKGTAKRPRLLQLVRTLLADARAAAARDAHSAAVLGARLKPLPRVLIHARSTNACATQASPSRPDACALNQCMRGSASPSRPRAPRLALSLMTSAMSAEAL